MNLALELANHSFGCVPITENSVKSSSALPSLNNENNTLGSTVSIHALDYLTGQRDRLDSVQSATMVLESSQSQEAFTADKVQGDRVSIQAPTHVLSTMTQLHGVGGDSLPISVW